MDKLDLSAAAQAHLAATARPRVADPVVRIASLLFRAAGLIACAAYLVLALPVAAEQGREEGIVR